MEFIDKKNDLFATMSVKQNMEMWNKGYLTLINQGYVHYCKMEELDPIYKLDPVVKGEIKPQ